MGFRNEAWATVWEVKQGRGNWMDVQLSISQKNKNGEYETKFSRYCMFINEARVKAEKLKPKDRIRLTSVDVETSYNKETGKEYINFKVFGFDYGDEDKTGKKPANGKQVPDNPLEEGDTGELDDEEETPF